LLPISDVVIDLHPSGRIVCFPPGSRVHAVEDVEERRRMRDRTLTWRSDYRALLQ